MKQVENILFRDIFVGRRPSVAVQLPLRMQDRLHKRVGHSLDAITLNHIESSVVAVSSATVGQGRAAVTAPAPIPIPSISPSKTAA